MIGIGHNIREVRGAFDRLVKDQIPYATSLALNDTAKDVLDAEQRHMQQVFDRPTRWTLNALMMRRSSKRNLTATVELKPSASRRHYLKVQASGGTRPLTGLERLMTTRLAYGGVIHGVTPTRMMKRDANGNMHRGELNKIISAVGAAHDRNQNTTAKSKRRHKGRREYFVPKPGSHLSPGVYIRTPAGNVGGKVLHFTQRVPQYQKRFNFEAVAVRTVDRHFKANFQRRLVMAIRTAR